MSQSLTTDITDDSDGGAQANATAEGDTVPSDTRWAPASCSPRTSRWRTSWNPRSCSALDIHPLVVLVVTALGGLLGGIVGLIHAVPAWVIAGNAITRLRSRGVVHRVAQRAQPAVQHLLD
jgi:hypothetical protein